MKCSNCGKNIEEDTLGKLKGTVIKIKKDNKNENLAVCDECQKKEDIREIKLRLSK
jgi:hypothetical protein